MVREPIAMYLVTVALGFAGREPWGIRLPSAVMGARTVLADARPGEYPLGAGMYALVPLERLSATDAKGQLLQYNVVVSGSSQVEH
jgi:hypothetical protein